MTKPAADTAQPAQEISKPTETATSIGGTEIHSLYEQMIGTTNGKDDTVRFDGTTLEFGTSGLYGEQAKPTDSGVSPDSIAPPPDSTTPVPTKTPWARTTDGEGGFVDELKGERPSDNFRLAESRDGKLELATTDGDKLSFSDDPTITDARKRLLEDAGRNISDPMLLSRFKADMIRLENRGLSSQEIVNTYSQVGRLFNADNGHVPKEQRTMLAEQVMSQAATPSTVDQGEHKTCAAATIESNIYSKNPSIAAKVVADAALTGQFTTPGGQTISLSRSNLIPDNEARLNPPLDGDRSFASQIFQNTALNTFYQSSNRFNQYEESQTPGARRSHTVNFRPLGIDTSSEPFKGLTSAETARMHSLITGSDKSVVLAHKDDINDGETGVETFKSTEELTAKLKEWKEQGRLPAIVSVHTGNPPFNSRDGGGHVVNVTDYDEKTGTVKVDNQWGSESDHVGVSVETLFAASRAPRENLREQIVKDNPSFDKGQVELAVLEGLQSQDKPVSALRLTLAMFDINTRFRDQGDKADPAERARVDEAVKKSFDKLSPKDKADFLSTAALLRHAVPPENFAGMFLATAKEANLTPDGLSTQMNPGLIDRISRLLQPSAERTTSDLMVKALSNLSDDRRDDVLKRLRGAS